MQEAPLQHEEELLYTEGGTGTGCPARSGDIPMSLALGDPALVRWVS